MVLQSTINTPLMEDQKDEKSIIDQLKEYVELQIKIAKYKAIDGVSEYAAQAVIGIVLTVIGLLVLLFASCTLALYLSSVLASYWQGFGCVALLYLLIMVIVIISKRAIKTSITNAVISKTFNS